MKNQRGNDELVNPWFRNWLCIWKKTDSYYYIMPKINSGSIQDLNVENQNLKKNLEKK